MSLDADVIIVGAGLSGLVAAAGLPQRGLPIYTATASRRAAQPPNSTSGLPNVPIATAQHEVGGHWRNVAWPFTDVILIGTVVRASPDDYWVAAYYQIPPGSGLGDFGWELLHYVQGTWTAYGHR